ncbi:DegT/DnrJ/EryC1/StrS family aminotransferase [Halobellus litoreus]|uniref:DegT/DnrJ/EryC1/StrS family aminotransferase n=1 Tax=Halobellus litoreus TaxID=755310 RepID=A0ABD6DX88_9EURY|nr:DegT/DnrJ/EryC1/StrS family aminotransferase [Halobellus litoreus]
MSGTPSIDGGHPIRDEVLGYGGQDITEREKEAVVEALDGDYITRGPTVEAFEEEVAAYVGADHAIAVTSGTAALHLLGEALFEDGDEVITTPLTFVSTANAACYAGAKPVFADVKRDTRNLDPDNVREKVTEDTAGIIPVHYAGQPCDISEILAIADEHDLRVIWDACHAIGSEWNKEKVGGQKDAAIFSFHPVKTVTTGEGGMVVTNDDDLAEKVRSLRSFRMDYSPEGYDNEPWYQVTEGVGYNYNFSDILASIGRVQLDRIGEFKRRRSEIFDRYQDTFADVEGLITPFVKDTVDPVWHLYAIEIDEEKFGCSRKEFVNSMHAENIGVQVHYVPLNHHPYFQEEFGYDEGDFPIVEEIYEGIVSLPLFPAMSEDDVEDVIQAVKRLHEHKRD